MKEDQELLAIVHIYKTSKDANQTGSSPEEIPKDYCPAELEEYLMKYRPDIVVKLQEQQREDGYLDCDLHDPEYLELVNRAHPRLDHYDTR